MYPILVLTALACDGPSDVAPIPCCQHDPALSHTLLFRDEAELVRMAMGVVPREGWLGGVGVGRVGVGVQLR